MYNEAKDEESKNTYLELLAENIENETEMHE